MLKYAVPALLTLLILAVSPLAAQDEAPEAMPLADEGDYDIINFLLLGSDTINPNNAGRTDVIMIVSVNRATGTVAFLSIPRDLYVHVPDWQMSKINTAYGHGQGTGYEGGGAQLIKDTIRFNLGIEIDYHARVDFNDFKAVIDNLGGVDIAVDCSIEDWRLIEPAFDPTLEESWAMFTLPVGVHHMDGDLALWYVRSRRTSSDLDRGRRQQAMMKAAWQRILDLNLLGQLGDVWDQVNETVRTDIDLPAMIDLVPLALTIETDHIASYTLRYGEEIVAGRSPDGQSILIPQREAMIAMSNQFLTPPTENQIVREQPRVEIVNASGWSELALVAADRLAWEGFVPFISEEEIPRQEWTSLIDYTGQAKGSSRETLRAVLRLRGDAVVDEPVAERQVDFRVVIGSAYRSCTHGVIEPLPPNEEDEVEFSS